MSHLAGQLDNDAHYRFIHRSVDNPEQIVGDILVTIPLEAIELDPPAFVSIRDVGWGGRKISIRLEAGDKTQGELGVRTSSHDFTIPLLSAPLYFAVYEVTQGDSEAAVRVLEENYDRTKFEWDFRRDCRDTLTFDAFVNVFDRLADHSQYINKMMYRSATGYFAKRIHDPGPQNITSLDTLEDRVRLWNQAGNFEAVSVDDIFAEYLGRNRIHDRLYKERGQLRSLGFDPEDYDRSWDSIVIPSWIAHILLTEGEDTVREFLQERPTPSNSNYSTLTEKAFDAEENRWEEWGDVVPTTINESRENFHYALYQYLRFAGKDYRGNAKVNPLLLAGAAQLTGPLPPFFHQRITFQEKIALGHEFRRDKNWTAAESAFKKAEAIATGEIASKYEFQPRKVAQAKKSRCHAEATLLAIDGDNEGARAKYSSTIQKLRQFGNNHNIPVSRHINFLEGEMEKEEE